MATANQSHYEVLSVPRTATQAEIRRAYLQKALKHHPDKDDADGATEYFQRILDAYEALSSRSRRFQYDSAERNNSAELAARTQSALRKAEMERDSEKFKIKASLSEACADGRTTDAMKLLRRAPAEWGFLNTADHMGKTPLMYVAENHRTQMVSLLMLFQADANAKNQEGWTALMFAVSSATGETEESASCSESCLQAVLKAKANPNLETNTGTTPLMIASSSGELASVQHLLEYEADCDLVDHSGMTALMLAADGGHAQVAKALLTAASAVDTADKSGRTALMYACSLWHKDVVEVLLEADANPNVCASDGCNALRCAIDTLGSESLHGISTGVNKAAVAVVAQLLEHRANPADGAALVQLAAQSGNDDIVSLLTGAGATRHHKSVDGAQIDTELESASGSHGGS